MCVPAKLSAEHGECVHANIIYVHGYVYMYAMRMKNNLWCAFLVWRYINLWVYKGSHNFANILVFETVFYMNPNLDIL